MTRHIDAMVFWAYAMFVCVVIWSCNTILYYNTNSPKIGVTEIRGVEFLNLLWYLWSYLHAWVWRIAIFFFCNKLSIWVGYGSHLQEVSQSCLVWLTRIHYRKSVTLWKIGVTTILAARITTSQLSMLNIRYAYEIVRQEYDEAIYNSQAK